jgi:hypothetical protein
LNAYSIPLLIYHLAIAGFDCSRKTLGQFRSHLRCVVTKARNYDAVSSPTTSLAKLAELGLFAPSIVDAIRRTGRFTVEDIHLDWFGQRMVPSRGALASHDFVVQNQWRLAK